VAELAFKRAQKPWRQINVGNSRIAVLDLTHGGAVIARKLKNIAASITGIDVYNTLSPDELERWKQKV